jgi:hypothetical protein
MSNQAMVDLIIAPCRVVAVRVSGKNNIYPSIGVTCCLFDGGLDFVQEWLDRDFTWSLVHIHRRDVDRENQHLCVCSPQLHRHNVWVVAVELSV